MKHKVMTLSSVNEPDIIVLKGYLDEGYSIAGFTYNSDKHCYVYIFVKVEQDAADGPGDNPGIVRTFDSTNQPAPSKKRFMFKNALVNIGVSPQVADDWIKVRKAKKAAQTETAFRIIEKQVKLGMEMFGVTADDIIRVAVDRNWQGFKCEWLDNIDWGFYGINVGHTDLPFDNKKWE